MRIKPKHWELARHFERFIDRKWYPSFTLTDQNVVSLIRFESEGKDDGTIPAFTDPRNGALVLERLTTAMLVDEMAEWWSNGNGWYYPFAHHMHSVFWTLPRDRVAIRSLVKIGRSAHDNFISLLNRFTGMSNERRSQLMARRFGEAKK